MNARQYNFGVTELRAVDPAAVIAKCTVFRARVGTHPAFPTLAEAQAFEAGWHAWHDGLACSFGGTPWSRGWLEAERAQDELHHARSEA